MNALPLRLSLFVAASAAVPVWACPGPENLDQGVIFRTEDGTVETHRRFNEDWIVIQAEFPDGTGSLLEVAHGLYLHSVTPIENGVIQLGIKNVYSTRPDIAQWPTPRPDTAWENAAETGGTATAGALRTLEIGSCSYEGYDIVLTFNDDPTYEERYHYLAGLGVGLLVGSTMNDEEETYTYTTVEAAP